MFTTVIIILIGIFCLLISYRIEDRFLCHFQYKIAYGKELEKLVREKYNLTKKGYGPWWLPFKETDHSLRMRAIREHGTRLYNSRVGDPYFEILPRWL